MRLLRLVLLLHFRGPFDVVGIVDGYGGGTRLWHFDNLLEDSRQRRWWRRGRRLRRRRSGRNISSVDVQPIARLVERIRQQVDDPRTGLVLDRYHDPLWKVLIAAREAAGVIVHEPANKAVAHMLVDMPFGAFPMALGVIYDDPRPTFESAILEQNAEAAAGKAADLQALVSKGQTWQVGKEPRPI